MTDGFGINNQYNMYNPMLATAGQGTFNPAMMSLGGMQMPALPMNQGFNPMMMPQSMPDFSNNAPAIDNGYSYPSAPVQVPAQYPQAQQAPVQNAQLSDKDLEILYKYANGEQLTPEEESMFSGFGTMATITLGMQYIPKGWNYIKMQKLEKAIKNGNLTEAEKATKLAKLESMKDAIAAEKAEKLAFIENYKNADSFMDKLKITHRNCSINRITESIPDAEKLEKLQKENKKVYEAYSKAKIFANRAKTADASKATEYLKTANRKLFTAKYMAHDAVKPTGLWGKIKGFFGKITGLSKVSKGVEGLAIKHPMIGKALKCGKGTGIWAMVAGGVELLTNVIPTFSQLGFGAGCKQLLKSTVKTAASIGGWAAGEAVGAEAGAAIGATIGSIVPGIGTAIGGAIGAVCGLAGGFAGSYLASKAADKICGKNELDKANEAKAKQFSAAGKTDVRALDQVATLAAQRIQAEGATPDSKIAEGSLKRVMAQMSQSSAMAEAPSYTQNPYVAQPQYQYQMPTQPTPNQLGTMGGLTFNNANVGDFTKNCYDGIDPQMLLKFYAMNQMNNANQMNSYLG
jgi:hypothetical protein